MPASGFHLWHSLELHIILLESIQGKRLTCPTFK
uniref:Uncharacterized protein n=1 Tax=Arundo donax TaxID=35708 RepID=A0A0A9E1G0_ARUDO